MSSGAKRRLYSRSPCGSIETDWYPDRQYSIFVAPRAGVWIETFPYTFCVVFFRVAPRAGVWIETKRVMVCDAMDVVAPRAGVWIET